MSERVSISPAEAADRLAIRELVEAYAYCADLYRRHALRGVHECQRSDSFTGAALARGACFSLRRTEQVQGYDAFRRTEHNLHAERIELPATPTASRIMSVTPENSRRLQNQ